MYIKTNILIYFIIHDLINTVIGYLILKIKKNFENFSINFENNMQNGDNKICEIPRIN
jgi:hypothetical protein